MLVALAVGMPASPSASAAANNSIDQSESIHHESANRPHEAANAAPDAPAGVAQPARQPTTAEGLFKIFTLLLAVAAITLIVNRKWHRLPRAEQPDPFESAGPLLFLAGTYIVMWIGLIVAMTIAVRTGAVVVEDDHTIRESDILKAGVLQRAGGYLFALPVLIVYARSLRARRARLRPLSATTGAPALPMPWKKAALCGLGALVLVYPIVMAATYITTIILHALSGYEAPVLAHTTLVQLRSSSPDVWVFGTIITVIIGAPVLEELMYRGMLQTGLRFLVRNAWLPILMTSILFTIMHVPDVDPHALVSLFVLALGFGWIYEKTQSIIAPIAMHAAFNLLNIALAFTATAT